MGGLNVYLQNKLLDHVFGDTPYNPPEDMWLGAFTAMGVNGEGGTEVSGFNYSRVQILNNATNWPAAIAAMKQLGVPISFPEAGGTWGSVVGVVLFDASSGGNRLFWDTFTAVPVVVGTTLTYPIGGISMTPCVVT